MVDNKLGSAIRNAIATIDLTAFDLDQVVQELHGCEFKVQKIDKVDALGLATVFGECSNVDPIRKIKGVIAADFDSIRRSQ